jgi:hypothetical protein
MSERHGVQENVDVSDPAGPGGPGDQGPGAEHHHLPHQGAHGYSSGEDEAARHSCPILAPSY